MGMFDTFVSKDGSLEVQLKNGPCLMHVHEEGDSIDSRDFPDAAYHGLEGVVVIRNGRVVSVTPTLPAGNTDLLSVTKWGEPFYPAPGETLADRIPIAAIFRVHHQEKSE